MRRQVGDGEALFEREIPFEAAQVMVFGGYRQTMAAEGVVLRDVLLHALLMTADLRGNRLANQET